MKAGVFEQKILQLNISTIEAPSHINPLVMRKHVATKTEHLKFHCPRWHKSHVRQPPHPPRPTHLPSHHSHWCKHVQSSPQTKASKSNTPAPLPLSPTHRPRTLSRVTLLHPSTPHPPSPKQPQPIHPPSTPTQAPAHHHAIKATDTYPIPHRIFILFFNTITFSSLTPFLHRSILILIAASFLACVECSCSFWACAACLDSLRLEVLIRI